MSIRTRPSATDPSVSAYRAAASRAPDAPSRQRALPLALRHPIAWASGHALAATGKQLVMHPNLSALASVALFWGAGATGVLDEGASWANKLVALPMVLGVMNLLSSCSLGYFLFEVGLKRLTNALDDDACSSNPAVVAASEAERQRVEARYYPVKLLPFVLKD